MKRCIAFLLALALLIPMTGCGNENLRVPGEFFYRRAETAYGTADGVIASEQRELHGIEGNPGAILERYLAGPESPELESPFPRDTQVLHWVLADDTLMLEMSPAFAAINGVELTIACTCITKTMLGLLDISQVEFEVPGALLGGEKTLTLSAGQISLSDDSLDQAWAEFAVYYTDRQQRYLIGQEVSVNLATEDDVIGHLIETMTRPPENSGLISAIPPGTDLLGYVIDDGVCTIDFSGEFEYNGWKKAEVQRLTLLSVVNTLTQLEQIRQVEFSIDGNLVVQYKLISITAPLERDASAIGPVRTGINEFDATLYLCNSPEPYLTPLPTRLRQSSGMSAAELVVSALLEYESHNGFYSPVPKETRLNSLMVLDGICHVDLSPEFLSEAGDPHRAIRAIVASVCALDGISGVRITIDGSLPEDAPAELADTLVPQTDWYV